MKRPLITLALILVAVLAILPYRDSQIPRATATLQLHPEFLQIRPTPASYTSPTTIHFIG